MKVVTNLSALDREGMAAVLDGEVAIAIDGDSVQCTLAAMSAETRALLGVAEDATSLTDEQRVSAIEAINDGKHLEIEVDMLTYRQPRQAGVKPNRKGVRVRPAGFRAMVRSARSTPFLRDHDWRELDARGGTVLAARAEEVDGEQILRETVRLTEPWAVSSYLKGNLDRFSVGMIPTSAVQCTACKAPVKECWHYPLETVADVLVEWEFDAQKVETSAVNVPAVEGTEVGPARLSAVANDNPAQLAPRKDVMAEKTEARDSRDEGLELRAQLLTAQESAARARTELEAVTKERDALKTDLEAERTERLEADAERWIAELSADGRVDATSTLATHLRQLYVSGQRDLAESLAAELTTGAHSPVSTPQRLKATPPAAAKRWELPRDSMGNLDHAALAASIAEWPSAVRERVQAFGANYSRSSNPVATMIALSRSGSLNELLAQSGYAPLEEVL